MANQQLKRPSDFDVIETARLYSLNPQLVKARVFAHFEAGYSAGETCLVLKGKTKSRSIQTYYSLWKELSEDDDSMPHTEYQSAGLLSANEEETDPIGELVSALVEWKENGQEPGPVANFVWMMTQWSRSGFRPGARPMYRDEIDDHFELRDLKTEVASLKKQLACSRGESH